jgi:hypothetical protein
MAEYGQLHPYFYRQTMRVWSDTRDMEEFVQHAKHAAATESVLKLSEEIIQLKMDNDDPSPPPQHHSWLRRLFACCTSTTASVQPYR